MAYWVKAVASLDNALGSPPTPKKEQEGWAAVQKAKQLDAKTQRERDYIGAVEVVFKDHDTVPFQTRAGGLRKGAGAAHVRYPEDSEAAVLYAFWLQVTADRNDQTFAQQLKSAKILEKVFAAQPHHPGAAHFLIHAYDFPAIAEHGLSAARHYASIAPDSPHALHMPSHIFSRVGEWQDSIDTNSGRAPRRSWTATSITRSTTWCTRPCSSAAMRMRASGSNSSTPSQKPNEETRQVAYAGAAIPARFALERGDWTAAAQLAMHPAPANFNWKPFPKARR